MSDEEIKLPTEEELARLPLKAVVAYVARCARRTLPLYQLPDSVRLEERIQLSRAVRSALIAAEDYCRGAALDAGNTNLGATAAASVAHGLDTIAAKVANAASHAASAAIAAAKAIAHKGQDVYTAYRADAFACASYGSIRADEAASKYDLAARAACLSDYYNLLSGIKLPVSEQGIDPSESGPLGPLWPAGPPDWYLPALREFEALVADEPTQKFLFPPEQSTQKQEPKEQSVDFIGQPMKVYVDAGGADEETIRDLYLALSAVYESRGGSGLQVVKHSQETLVCDEVPV